MALEVSELGRGLNQTQTRSRKSGCSVLLLFKYSSNWCVCVCVVCICVSTCLHVWVSTTVCEHEGSRSMLGILLRCSQLPAPLPAPERGLGIKSSFGGCG